MKFYLLNLIGGGGDLACAGCLSEAKRERHDQLRSTAVVDAPGESCGWCGIEAERAA